MQWCLVLAVGVVVGGGVVWLGGGGQCGVRTTGRLLGYGATWDGGLGLFQGLQISGEARGQLLQGLTSFFLQ